MAEWQVSAGDWRWRLQKVSRWRPDWHMTNEQGSRSNTGEMHSKAKLYNDKGVIIDLSKPHKTTQDTF